MASRESSTRSRRPPPGTLFNPNSSNPPSRSNTTSTKRHNSTRSTSTANRNQSPPKSKPSSPPLPAANGDVSRENSRNLRPSNSTRHHSGQRSAIPNPQQQSDRDRRPTRRSPERRPSTRHNRDGTANGTSSRNPDTSAKPLPRVRLEDPPSGSQGLERKDTAASARRETDLNRSGSLSRNDSGRSSREKDRDLARSGSTRRRDVQTSANATKANTQPPRQDSSSPPKAYTPPNPLSNPYYKPFTPFKPFDQERPRVKYADGYERPVNEHGQFLDRDAEKLVPMNTGSTVAGWVMVPDRGSVMVCSRCKEPVNPFRPKKSHRSCR
ncbi:hypothetical protein D9758_004174 [Tetrapyrgos nigripes]|uniref:Uncharacterized protein n=1 Tax=Tetrapyrgos nigripes TaxID=182062 RepID=A0A8H5GUG8_9AGAR|nr:hypothetical protein D9758_004174 [Tetrapyrgos nigripes]